MVRLRHLATVAPLLAGLVLGLGVIVPMHGVGRGSVVASPAATETPHDAIAALVQSNGDLFAGPCEATRSPEDIGKICARKIDEQGSLQAYLIGRTFSEFSAWVFVGPRVGGWRVVATEPLDFHDMSMTIPWPR